MIRAVEVTRKRGGAAAHLVLLEVVGRDLGADGGGALVGLLLAGDAAQEGRLAGAVGPEERDAVARLDGQAHVLEERVARAVAVREPAHDGDLVDADAGRRREAELELARVARRPLDDFLVALARQKLVQFRLPLLRLGRAYARQRSDDAGGVPTSFPHLGGRRRLVLVLVDPRPLLLYPSLLRGVRRLPRFQLLLLQLYEAIVVAIVRGGYSFLRVNNFGAHLGFFGAP